MDAKLISFKFIISLLYLTITLLENHIDRNTLEIRTWEGGDNIPTIYAKLFILYNVYRASAMNFNETFWCTPKIGHTIYLLCIFILNA